MMGGILISVIAISLFFGGTLVFLHLYTKYEGTPKSRKLLIGGTLAFVLYTVSQTIAHIYSADELEVTLISLCEGSFAGIGFLLLVFSLMRNVSNREVDQEIVSRGVIVVIVVAYFSGLALPSFVANQVETYCANESRMEADKIIKAVRDYMAVEGKFPANLNSLLPVYLTETPSPGCFSVYSPLVPTLTNAKFLRKINYSMMMNLIKLKKLEYRTRRCEWNEEDVYDIELYLIVPTVDLNEKNRYNFSNNSWQTIPYYHDECLSYGVGS